MIVSAPYRCYVKNMGESRQQCSQHLGINEEKLLYEQSSKTNAVQLTMDLQTTNAHSNEMPKKDTKVKKNHSNRSVLMLLYKISDENIGKFAQM